MEPPAGARAAAGTFTRRGRPRRALDSDAGRSPDRPATGARRRQIEAVAATSALLGYVFLDRFNRPLGPAIIWMDNRAGAEADEIRRRIPEKTVYRQTGRRVSPELLAPKLMWLAREQPGMYRRLRAVIGLKDEMVRRLTGAVGTDRSHLDYSLLFDIRKGRIDADIAAALGIDPGVFPEPQRAAEVAGRLAPEAARRIGLPVGLPWYSGSSDGTAAMYGGGVLTEGTGVLVTGTTDVLMTACSGWTKDRSCTITANSGMVPGIYLAGGAMGLSGGAVQHLERLMRVRMRPLAEKIKRLPPGADGLLMLPGLTGERSPYWMEYATGGMAGLTLRHGHEHVFRAAMEGAALRTACLLNRMQACSIASTRLHVVGGWADNDAWNLSGPTRPGWRCCGPKRLRPPHSAQPCSAGSDRSRHRASGHLTAVAAVRPALPARSRLH